MKDGTSVQQQELDAVVHRILNATVRLIDRTNATQGGSAVLVNLGSQLVLATAAHVAPNDHKIEIVPRPGQNVSIPRFIKADQVNDVAVLQVEQLAEFVDRAITLADIETEVNWSNSQHVVVVGYPGEYLKVVSRISIDRMNTVEIHGASAHTYATVSVPTSEWPGDWFGEQPEVTRDIFAYYERQRIVSMLKRVNVDVDPPVSVGDLGPALSGISGGGMWLDQIDGELVRYPRPKLVGIQVALGSKYEMIRGIQIRHWLNLLKTCSRNLD